MGLSLGFSVGRAPLLMVYVETNACSTMTRNLKVREDVMCHSCAKERKRIAKSA